MTDAWVVIVGLGLGTYGLKAAGPLLLGGRKLPTQLTRVTTLLPAALLAALVATSSLGEGSAVVLDARLPGLFAAALALWARVPFVGVVIIAAAVTAAFRAVA